MVLRWRKALIAGGAAVAATGSLYVSVPAARAQTLPAGCVETGARVTCRYAFTGSPQQFTVPPKVTFLIVDLIGAAGGHGCRDSIGIGGDGGKGAQLKGYVIFPPNPTGRVVDVYVGGKGGAAETSINGRSCNPVLNGGYNGGGGGGFTAFGGNAGGAGGGASDIRTGRLLADRVAVAAGGGGGAGGGFQVYGGEGGNGGASGHPGSTGQASSEGGFPGGHGGPGATPAAPGAGGVSSGQCAGQPGFPGTLGHGGAGAGVVYPLDGRVVSTESGCGGRGPAPGGLGTGGGGTGGGGGGGVYGGGGGGWGDKPNGGTIFKEAGGGGGGGGSSFIDNPNGSTITSGVATDDGNGRVTITYNIPR